jgi:hypothetical protein
MYMVKEVTFPEMAAFLERYKRFTTETADLRVRTFQDSFVQFKVAMQAITKLGRALERQQARRFNLFQLLGVARDERRTHSAFLRELLNPEGCHGQGHLFLETFFEYCWQKAGFDEFPRPTAELSSALWIVETEKGTAFGNIDVLLYSPELQVVLVIENKTAIDAREQERQLERYATWMARTYPKYGKALVFLTPDGRASVTHREARYYRLSYREDIQTWLESAMPMILAPRVREMVSQYMEVVNTL